MPYRKIIGAGPSGPPRLERKWWTLITVCVAIFMLLMDITIVNVALPRIADDLHASFSDLQWVIDAYALLLAALMLTAGSLGDLFGRKRIFAAGLVIFSTASLLCGLSPDAQFLIILRGVQGVGGAIMFATSLALIAQEFEGRDRGTAFGVFGAVTGLSVAIGPLVGGALTTGLSWRWIFFVNVPIGIVAVGLTLRKLRESRDRHARRVDWFGVVTFSTGLFALVYALVRGNTEGWTSAEILGLLIGFAVLMSAFVVGQWRQRQGMFDLSLFRVPTFNGASVAAVALSASIFSLFLYITLYLQNVLGYSPLQAGLRLLPTSLLSFAVSAAAGKASASASPRLLIGGGLGVIGLGLMLMHGVTVGDSWTGILPGLVVSGVGIGLVNPPLASAAIGVVRPQRSGMASGINGTFRQVGISCGIAGLGALFAHRIASDLAGTLAGTPAAAHAGRLAHAVSSGGVQAAIHHVPPGARHAVAAAARSSFISGFNEVLLAGAIVAFAGAVLTLLLIRPGDFVEGARAQTGGGQALPRSPVPEQV